MTFTEQQLTSAVALYLEDHPTDPKLSNPQVFLRDGKIQLYGTAEVQGLSVDATFVIVPRASGTGAGAALPLTTMVVERPRAPWLLRPQQ